MTCKKPVVWAVPGRSTYSGKATVRFAIDGNINTSDGGHIKTFSNFTDAKKFARRKAKEYGVKAQIHPK